MGYYVEVEGSQNKAKQLMVKHGATPIDPPSRDEFVALIQDWAVLCIARNEDFDAALIVYDLQEYERTRIPDRRVRQWLLLDKEKAANLCP